MSNCIFSRQLTPSLRFSPWLLMLVALSATGSALAEWETFKSAPIESSKSESIQGFISRPAGSGPFPAVIIAHGCFGVEKNQYAWSRRLNDWGYVTLILDSFSPRNIQNVCAEPEAVSPETRACDVFGAAAYLRKQTFVSPLAIGLIGFSHGGWTALHVSQDKIAAKAKEDPLQAVVAYYPWCPRFGLKRTKTPLLVMIGKEDDWTPMDRCVSLLNKQRKGFREQVKLIVFDNANHGFDDSSAEPAREHDGHTIAFDGGAAAKSIENAKAFLAGHLAP